MENYEVGVVVWVRLGQTWWPGVVASQEKCPKDFLEGLRKKPLLIVKFFNENEYQDIHKHEHIFPYNCSRKYEFIKKGYNQSRNHEVDLQKKFESDVITAEKLTGGEMNILESLKDSGKERVDYSDLGFGHPKTKKRKDDEMCSNSNLCQHERCHRKKYILVEYKVKIMEQPKQENIVTETARAINFFKCHLCGYTCSRVNVMMWHNRSHINKICNYDSGIIVPGRKKRKQATPKANKQRKSKSISPNTKPVGSSDESPNASKLLMDWSDGEEEKHIENNKVLDVHEQMDSQGDKRNEFSDEDFSDNEYPPLTPKAERQPMRDREAMDSAFDALLAEGTNSPNTSKVTNFASNNSDSEGSDWDKCSTKSEDHEVEGSDLESKNFPKENGIHNENEVTSQLFEENETASGSEHFQEEVNFDFSPKSSSNCDTNLCSDSAMKHDRNSSDNLYHDCDNSISTSEVCGTKELHNIEDLNHSSSFANISHSSSIDETLPNADATFEKTEDTVSSQSSEPTFHTESKSHNLDCYQYDTEKSDQTAELHKISNLEENVDLHSKVENFASLHSENTSPVGSAYMLVAVDSHANNVPVTSLGEGNRNFVAVEATMDDGSTRTIYIDPAQLGPSVDLNNLMLHIDPSGQETVIISSIGHDKSSSDSVFASSIKVKSTNSVSATLSMALESGDK